RFRPSPFRRPARVSSSSASSLSLVRRRYRASMRLELLSVFDWSYDEDVRVAAPGYAIVSAYGSEEGIGYGEGRGTATGRLEGTVVWSNYPRRRTDGRMLPNVRGLIKTADGASILFELRGRTIFDGDEP